MTIKIITGPSLSGKSRIITQTVAKVIRNNRIKETTLLLPSAKFVRNFAEHLIGQTDENAVEKPTVLTFSRLANLIIEQSDANIQKISKLKSQVILKSIIERHLNKGAIIYHKEAAPYYSFISYLEKFIANMKRAAIEPEAIIKQFPSKSRNRKISELAALYFDYQNYLYQNNLYDTEGVFWRALGIISSKTLPPTIQDCKLLLMDGFTSFTAIQRKFIIKISNIIPEVIITLTYEKDDARESLFEETRRTLLFFSGLGAEITQRTRSSGNGNDAIEYLERNIFKRKPEAGRPADINSNGINLFCAEDITTEIRVIASRIKELATGKRVSLDRIALVIPQVKNYRQYIERIFTDSGIPCFFEQHEPIGSIPPATFLKQFLKATFSDMPRYHFKALIKSQFFSYLLERPAELLPEKDILFRRAKEDIANLASKIIEASSVRDGIKHWKEYLENLQGVEKSSTAQKTSRALLNLIKIAEKARSAKSLEDICLTIDTILARIDEGLRNDKRKANLIERFRNIKGVEHLRGVFVHELPRLEHVPFRKKSKSIREITQLALNQEAPNFEESNYGKVTITTPSEIRGHRTEHIFLAGMNENQFPRYNAEGSRSYEDVINRITIATSENTPNSFEMAEDQMLLFYTAITGTQKTITFSWVENGVSNPSVFIEDLKNTLFPINIKIKSYGSLPFIEDPETIISKQDLFISMLAGGDKSKLSLCNDDRKKEAHKLTDKIETLRKLAQIENDRLSPAPFSVYDGIIGDSKIRLLLKRVHSPEKNYSISFFADFGKCPFKFLASRLLDLTPPEEKAEESNSRDEGTFYHDVLKEFYSSALKNGEIQSFIKDPQQSKKEQLLKMLGEILKKNITKIESENQVILTPYWKAVTENYKTILYRFVDFDLNHLSQARLIPSFFETSFGTHEHIEGSQTESEADSVAILKDGEQIKLRGRIDRIDIGEDTAQVLDYKRSNIPEVKKILEGTDFQMPIYLLATCKILEAADQQREEIFSRFASIKKMQYSKEEIRYSNDRISTKKEKDILIPLRSYMFAYISAIRKGIFPPASKDKNECKWCGIRRLCRFDQKRIDSKRIASAKER